MMWYLSPYSHEVHLQAEDHSLENYAIWTLKIALLRPFDGDGAFTKAARTRRTARAQILSKCSLNSNTAIS